MMRVSPAFFVVAGVFTFAGCTSPAPDSPSRENSADRERIEAAGAPEAIGPYSQAIRSGDLLFLAGQIGIDPATGTLVEGGIEAETTRAMDNIKAVLEEAGLTMEHVVQSQVFLADLEDYSVMNEIYAGYFGVSPPSRAAVQVARLPRDARIEIMMTAAR